MNPIFLVTETPSDLRIIKALLPKSTVEKVEFKVSSQRSMALSIARTLLSSERFPVILAVDAAVTESKPVSELRSTLEFLLRDAAGGVPHHLVLFVPRAEILLIPDEQEVRELAGNNAVSPYEVEFAMLQPKRYLQDKMPTGNGDYEKQIVKYLKNLSPQRKARLAENPTIKDVQQFVANHASTTMSI